MDTIADTASGQSIRDDIRALHSTCGIEIQPLGHAPFGEIVKVNVHSENPDHLSLEALLTSLGGCQPLRIGPMEFVTILKHSAEPEIIVGPIPGHADDFDLHKNAPDENKI